MQKQSKNWPGVQYPLKEIERGRQENKDKAENKQTKNKQKTNKQKQKQKQTEKRKQQQEALPRSRIGFGSFGLIQLRPVLTKRAKSLPGNSRRYGSQHVRN